jgi:hypothetical protein
VRQASVPPVSDELAPPAIAHAEHLADELRPLPRDQRSARARADAEAALDPVAVRMLPRAIATANVDVDRDPLGSCSRLAHDGRRPDGTGRHQMTRDDT